MRRINKEPKIEVKSLPNRKMSVKVKGYDVSCASVLKAGFKKTVYWYYHPGGYLHDITKTEVTRKIMIGNEKCYEVRVQYYTKDNKKTSCEELSYFAVKNDGIHYILRIYKEGPRSPIEVCNYQDEDEIVPLKESSTKRENIIKSFFVTKRDVVELKIGSKKEICLRVTYFTNPEEKKWNHVAAEEFYAPDGKVLLFRRYNGKGWKNLDKLKKNATLKHGKETFYHWYDCVPRVTQTKK